MTKDQIIYIGADHAGFDLKEEVKHYLYGKGCTVEDLGNDHYEEHDDYPDYGVRVARAVSEHAGSYGIVFCGSGYGMAIVANKVSGVRAVNIDIDGKAENARKHNRSNVLSLSARYLTSHSAKSIIDMWLKSSYQDGDRHERRVNKIAKIEKEEHTRVCKNNRKRKSVIPAILEDTVDNVHKKLRRISGESLWVQLDIMDGKFVQEESFRLKDFKGQKWPFLFEAHLMVEDPKSYIDTCFSSGMHRVIVHIEAVGNDMPDIIHAVHHRNMEVGIAVNPDNDLSEVFSYRNDIDTVLIMGVQPGSSGQELIEGTVQRVEKMKKNIPWSVRIGVDGGMNPNTIREVSAAGADHFCTGSAIFMQDDPVKALQEMKKLT